MFGASHKERPRRHVERGYRIYFRRTSVEFFISVASRVGNQEFIVDTPVEINRISEEKVGNLFVTKLCIEVNEVERPRRC